MKRTLSQREEQALRLCHHEFEGMTTKLAAKAIGISQRRVQQLLQSIKLKAPQMFPILTKRQTDIRFWITEKGCTLEQTAGILLISRQTVAKTVETLRKKGVCLEKRKPTLQYQNYMDDKMVQKF